MKLSSFLPLGLSTLALAAPTPTTEEKRGVLAKRASVTDTPSTGYATQNGGTTGGRGGSTTTVSTFAQFTAAVSGDSAAVVIVTAPMESQGATVRIGANKSVIGKDSSVVFTGISLFVRRVNNVIIRNLAVRNVVGGDAIQVQGSTNVWLDHLNLSSDMTHDKDYYDGLLDINHGSDYVTISNVYLHDHYKTSLVGHSDNNAAEDTGHLRVTYYNNYWKNVNSRAPSLRFGTGHIFNNYYENVPNGINTRMGAQVLVQNNVFVGGTTALYSKDSDTVGYAVENGNDFGGAANTAPKGTLNSVPYSVPTLLAASAVKAAVVGTAGNTLKF